MNPQTPEKKRYKVILILLVGLAAYSSAIKELNSLKGMVGSVYEFTSGWIDTGLITANAKHISAKESSCADSVLLTQGSAPEIVLDLPATINTEIKADTFNGEISTDFPLSLLGKMSRKHLSGRIGNGGRELVLKTLNGSIKLRRAG